jgi:hypothetical protein
MDKIKHLKNKYSIARYDLIQECEGDELRFYLYLKLYAINKSEAFPSYKTIQNDLGWQKSKTSRLIKKMIKSGRLLVGKKRSNTRGGKQPVNLYDITWYDKINERGCKNEIKGLQKQNTLYDKGVAKIGHEQLENITNRNITSIAKQSFAGLNDLIDLFKDVNPSWQKLFKNKTQRAALERLVKQHGREKMEWAIKILHQTNQMKYFPTICTPLELENKLGTLLARLSQEKNEQNKNKIIKI